MKLIVYFFNHSKNLSKARDKSGKEYQLFTVDMALIDDEDDDEGGNEWTPPNTFLPRKTVRDDLREWIFPTRIF